MAIVFHEKTKVFHIYNDKISYIFMILKNGQPGQLYFGRRLRDREDFDHMFVCAKRDMGPCVYQGDSSFSMDNIRQEYPVRGNGDLRNTACVIRSENGSRDANFSYVSHNIYQGKPALKGLPASYVESENEATTLELTLRDELLCMELTLRYTIYETLPILTRNASFYFYGKGNAYLERVMSASIDLPDSDYEMLTFTGAWARERQVTRSRLQIGVQSIYSLRGHSSHQFNPFMVLKRPQTTEDSGEAIGACLVYSGNFLGQAEVDNYHVTRLMMGIHPENFCWCMEEGNCFETPEVIFSYSSEGLQNMSHALHKLLRTRVAKGYWRDRQRPVLINNWEATYMKFDEEKLLRLAQKAKQAGIELFVLDDGWFGHRDADTTSLGDWTEDLRKLPRGLKGLGEEIEKSGMKFGIWIEPEMISEDSNLFRAHPEWRMHVPGRRPHHGRNQFELDLSRPEVVDYLTETLSELLRKAPISFVKWDMNRSMTDVYSESLPASQQGEVYHRQILGFYQLCEKLTTAFPEVLFESCASGGARFDAGVLYYFPQGWVSDDTDAIERLKIQYGTSFCYPLSCMDNHVSAIPNHQLFRKEPLKTRGDVAYFGSFGYELDLEKLTEGELEEIHQQICFYHEWGSLMQTGTFYRLISPESNQETAWAVVSEDQKTALVGYYRMLQPMNAGFRSLILRGLDLELEYQIEEVGFENPMLAEKRYYGDELMACGFDISDTGFGPKTPAIYQGDYQSRIFIVKHR